MSLQVSSLGRRLWRRIAVEADWGGCQRGLGAWVGGWVSIFWWLGGCQLKYIVWNNLFLTLKVNAAAFWVINWSLWFHPVSLFSPNFLQRISQSSTVMLDRWSITVSDEEKDKSEPLIRWENSLGGNLRSSWLSFPIVPPRRFMRLSPYLIWSHLLNGLTSPRVTS